MIRTREEGPVRVLTLDRPDRRNALTPEGLDELRDAVETVDPRSTPVVYLHGAGTAFCAGADLSIVESLLEGEASAFARRGQKTANALEESDAAVVAGIDGPARGGGVELALAADVRIATPDASFAEPGVSIGLFGAWGGTRRLPSVVGESCARDLSLSGRTIDAAEALQIGLVSRVVDDPMDVAREIADGDRDALLELAALLRDRGDRTDGEQERAERSAFERLLAEDPG